MRIAAHLNPSRKLVYEIFLSDEYELEAELETMVVSTIEDHELKVTCKIVSMPGICVLDEIISSTKSADFDFSVDGEHFLINLFYSGSCKILDQTKGNPIEYHAGIVKRDHVNSIRWNIGLHPGQKVNRLTFILAGKYGRELLRNEAWALDDPFFSDSGPQKAHHKNEEHYFADLQIKNVLNDLLQKQYIGILRRPFFELKLKELLFMLHAQHELSSLKNHLSSELYRKLVMAKAHLISHFAEPPTIRQLSRIISLNEFKLKNHFKEVFGITIHNFIVRLRMEEAERLLMENYSVNDMSAKTGYRSVSHFIETFKKYYGMTPKRAMTEYRSGEKYR